jgi:hypothetical protein
VGATPIARTLKRPGCSLVGFGQRTFSRIVQQCQKEKRLTGSRSLLNTGMGLLLVSTLTPGHFGTVIGSPASLHANVKSKAVSSPVRSSACTPTGDANESHNPVAQCMGSIRCWRRRDVDLFPRPSFVVSVVPQFSCGSRWRNGAPPLYA